MIVLNRQVSYKSLEHPDHSCDKTQFSHIPISGCIGPFCCCGHWILLLVSPVMGCASSKEKVCPNCRAHYSPVRRSFTFNGENRTQKTGDGHHVVALTSSTLGSLKLDPWIHNSLIQDKDKGESHMILNQYQNGENGEIDINNSPQKGFEMEMIEAKTWAKMIDEKIPKVLPKTPIVTHPGEPEMINAWELMEGLEDIIPLRPARHFRSFSFHVPTSYTSFSSFDEQPTPIVKEEMDSLPQTTSFVDMADNDDSNSNSIVPEFDPEVIAAFRRALEELPPANTFHLNPLIAEKQQQDTASEENKDKDTNLDIPANKDRVVVYFTSLRGVRKTYEDCCHVRVILKGLGVRVDERDVSMHSGFKEELKELLGNRFVGAGLPQVFIGKKYIGGADDIRRLNEEGRLEKMAEGCDSFDDQGIVGSVNVCEACGDIRFMPCQTCCGSCKLFYEGDYEDEQPYDENEYEYGFRRCPHCNENGLVRCPICCD